MSCPEVGTINLQSSKNTEGLILPLSLMCIYSKNTEVEGF